MKKIINKVGDWVTSPAFYLVLAVLYFMKAVTLSSMTFGITGGLWIVCGIIVYLRKKSFWGLDKSVEKS